MKDIYEINITLTSGQRKEDGTYWYTRHGEIFTSKLKDVKFFIMDLNEIPSSFNTREVVRWNISSKFFTDVSGMVKDKRNYMFTQTEITDENK